MSTSILLARAPSSGTRARAHSGWSSANAAGARVRCLRICCPHTPPTIAHGGRWRARMDAGRLACRTSQCIALKGSMRAHVPPSWSRVPTGVASGSLGRQCAITRSCARCDLSCAITGAIRAYAAKTCPPIAMCAQLSMHQSASQCVMATAYAAARSVTISSTTLGSVQASSRQGRRS